MMGTVIEAETLNPAQSSDYMLVASVSNPRLEYVGYFDAGSYICYDRINMTGVRSIELEYAKGRSSNGRFAIIINGNSLGAGTNLGEKITTPTSSSTTDWETFQTLRVGLSQQVSGEQRLCFVGLTGGGIFNLDKFTLSDRVGENDGITPNPSSGPDNDTNVQGVLPITTQGNQVLFGGRPGSIAGMSLFWSNNNWGGDKFYNADVVRWLKRDWNIKLIRAAMGVGTEPGGYIQSPGPNRQRVQTIVNAAIENDLYVIIDWHAHEAENYRDQAIAFFTDMARQYGQYNNVIYEIYNEPLQNTSWDNTIKPYAERVIAAIRAIDPDNLIIVGTRSWSQRVDEAAANPIRNYPNIAYTLHFYAGTHKQAIRNYATTALNNGIPLFVTEWGTTDASGDGAVDVAETRIWMDFLRTNNISHANWALNDKAEGSAALRPGASVTGGWSDTNLTASGRLVRDYIRSW